MGHPVAEEDQAGQAELVFHKLMVAWPHPRAVLQVLTHSTYHTSEQVTYHENKLQKKQMKNITVMLRLGTAF